MKELNGISYLERLPTVTTEKASLFLLIHGYGSNEEDLMSFAQDLPAEAYVVSVRAPFSIMYGGYAWYAIDFVNNEKFMDIDQALESRKLLVDFIDSYTTQKEIDADNVWLAGFSQGAILTYAIALNNPDKVKHALILSGYPEQRIIGDLPKDKDYSGLSFFVSHGVEDVVLPIEWGRDGEQLLKDLSIKHEYHEYRSGHGIHPQNYHDMLAWIALFK